MNAIRGDAFRGAEMEVASAISMLAHCRRRAGREANRLPDTFRLCARCRQGRARFVYRGQVRADREHDLCMRCYRSALTVLRTSMITRIGGMRKQEGPGETASV